MEKVKLGVVGCGLMAQLVHLPILAELKQCEVVALAELRPELGAQIAEKFGVPRLYRSHKELAEDPEVDAVVAVIGDDLHAAIAIDLLHAGKHVLIEKPLATNVADGEAMVKAAESSNVTLMVNFMKRYDPGVELAARIVTELRDSAELGELESVQTHRFGNDWFCNIGEPIATAEAYPEVARSAPAWLPDGLANTFRHVNNVYCHNLDLLHYFLGDPTGIEFVHIATNPALESQPTFGSGRTGKPWRSQAPSGADMQIIALLRFADVYASMICGSSSGEFWDEETVVRFSNGWVAVKTPPPLLRNVSARVEVCKANDQREMPRLRSAWEWSFRRAHEHFLDCIVNGTTTRSSGRVALENLRTMEAILGKYVESGGVSQNRVSSC